MKKLIVNADDFGYTTGVNAGIIQAHLKGIVTSTSLMVYGRAAAEAKDLSKYSKLSLGLHFQITSEGLRADLSKYLILPFLSVKKIKKEFDEQVNEFMSIVGMAPDHLDSHHHVHLRQNVRPVFEDYSKKHKIPVRGFNGVNFMDDFFGWNSLRISDPSKISTDFLLKILSELKDGTSEIMCHPGISDSELRKISKYSDERSGELKTLTSPKIIEFVKKTKILLINWKDI